jgi:pterin-4a-carbinolamine dehydratase
MAQDERIYGPAEVEQRLAADLPNWELRDGAICRRFRTGGWKASLMVANAVGYLAEAAWHHPDLVVGYPQVEVRLSTHSAGGITDKDFTLARRIEDLVTWRPGAGSALEGTPEDPRFRILQGV